MTTALVLIIGFVVTGMTVPSVLAFLSDTSLSPAPLLWMWWSVIAGAVLSIVAALLVLLLHRHDDLSAVEGLLASCWAALHSGPLHVDGGATLAVAAVLILAGVRTATRIGRSVASVRRRSRTLLESLGPVGRWEHGVFWIDHPDAFAFSVGGRARAVVASTGLRRHLGTAEVQAVLDHERSHLTGRHHVQVLIADALARALPVLPLFRRAPGAIRLLVELAADDRATRRNDREVLRRALIGVTSGGATGAPPGTLGAVGSSIECRLSRLARHGRQRSRERRIGECAVAGVVGSVLPPLAGSVAAVLLLLASC